MPVLKYFDCNKPVVLSVDSSSVGLGAVLLQDNLPVAYASKSLTCNQKMWAQIEKELLAIVHGCERFHQYIFGKTVYVESDHKPLEQIFKKSLDETPLRLQRLRLRLQQYDIVIKYKPGKDLLLADALSRSFNVNDTGMTNIDQDVELHINLIVENLSFSNEKLKLFVKETASVLDCIDLKNYIINGWPNNINQIPNHLRFFYSMKDELYFVNGLIFKNKCVIVPKVLRKEVLELIHYNHLGIEKCKNRAKRILFWPHMLKEIEDKVRNCMTCLKFQRTHSGEEMLLRDVPNGPWEQLGIDIFYFKTRKYLLIVDYFSKFIEIKELQQEISPFIIAVLKSNFSRYGIPKVVYSDNGPQFTSLQFKKFTKTWNFNHITSSPYYPKSNGMAERYVQTFKNMLKKADYAGTDIYI